MVFYKTLLKVIACQTHYQKQGACFVCYIRKFYVYINLIVTSYSIVIASATIEIHYF